MVSTEDNPYDLLMSWPKLYVPDDTMLLTSSVLVQANLTISSEELTDEKDELTKANKISLECLVTLRNSGEREELHIISAKLQGSYSVVQHITGHEHKNKQSKASEIREDHVDNVKFVLDLH